MGPVALQPSPTQYHLASNGHTASGSTVPKEREREHLRMTVKLALDNKFRDNRIFYLGCSKN